MLSKTQLRILEETVKNERHRQSELGAALSLKPPTISESLRGLRKEGFITEGNGISEKSHAQYLAKLLKETSYSFKFLAGANLEVMLSLLEPKTLQGVIFESEYSRAQVFKTFCVLRARGLLARKGGSYELTATIPGLREFLSAYRAFAPLSELPPYATVLKRFRKGGMLVMAPKGGEINGGKTSFSRFAEFGIGLSSERDYYFLPKKNLSIKEIFAHALHSATTIRERMLCVLFYMKNRKNLDKNELIEKILAGRETRDWPSPAEIKEAALQYGLRWKGA